MTAKEEVKETKRKRREWAIALDYDDTVVDFLGHLCSWHNHLHGTAISKNDIPAWNFSGLDVRDTKGNQVTGEDLMKTFTDYEGDGLYACLPALPNALKAMNLFKRMGYKIVVITARKEQFRRATEMNAWNQNFPIDEVVFSSDKVGSLRELNKRYNIKAFCDDKLVTVEDIYNRCNIDKVFLMTQAHNKNIEIADGIIRVNDLVECVRYLDEA